MEPSWLSDIGVVSDQSAGYGRVDLAAVGNSARRVTRVVVTIVCKGVEQTIARVGQ